MRRAVALTWIDHLVFVTPSLEDGVAAVGKALGVVPVYGGAHIGRGTHNALLSLGPPTYLEVIAPDPAQDGAGPSPFGLDAPEVRIGLGAFAVGCDDIDAVLADLRARGVADAGPAAAMSRVRPDGSELSWRLAMLGGPPHGAMPFLISWGGAASPAHSSPRGGRLVALRAGHPDPPAASALLAALGVDVTVEAAPTDWLEATVETDDGLVLLH